MSILKKILGLKDAPFKAANAEIFVSAKRRSSGLLPVFAFYSLMLILPGCREDEKPSNNQRYIPQKVQSFTGEQTFLGLAGSQREAIPMNDGDDGIKWLVMPAGVALLIKGIFSNRREPG